MSTKDEWPGVTEINYPAAAPEDSRPLTLARAAGHLQYVRLAFEQLKDRNPVEGELYRRVRELEDDVEGLLREQQL